MSHRTSQFIRLAVEQVVTVKYFSDKSWLRLEMMIPGGIAPHPGKRFLRLNPYASFNTSLKEKDSWSGIFTQVDIT